MDRNEKKQQRVKVSIKSTDTFTDDEPSSSSSIQNVNITELSNNLKELQINNNGSKFLSTKPMDSAMSKNEIRTQRKAKAAEAKARKAAAAEMKKNKELNMQPHTSPNEEKSLKEGKHAGKSMVTSKEKEQAELRTDEAEGDHKFISKLAMAKVDKTFAHSPSFVDEHELTVVPSIKELAKGIHPAFLALSDKCEAKMLNGVDAVCVAFIAAFKEFLHDYKLNVERKISQDLDHAIKPHLNYLTLDGTKEFPYALGNVIRQLKKEIQDLPDNTTESEGKKYLFEWLDLFISQNFNLALESIASLCIEKIANFPVILIYSWCPVVQHVILEAYKKGLNFQVCILDSTITRRGRHLVKLLNDMERNHTYGLVNAAGYLIKKCQLILLGCSAVFSDGSIMAELGAGILAMHGAFDNIPVIVVAQSYKFVDKVRYFSFYDDNNYALVDDKYERIPAERITAIITEIRSLPPTSVPAVLKAKQLVVT